MTRKRWRIRKSSDALTPWEVTGAYSYAVHTARFATFPEAVKYVDVLAYLAGYSSERVG